MEEQYKSSFVRALAERWQFWRPMAVEKVGKMDRVPRLILKSALDTFDVFNRMPEFLDKLDGDDKVRLVIEAEIKALAAAIDVYPDISVYGQPEGKIEEKEPIEEAKEEPLATEEAEPTEEVEPPEALDAEPTLKDVFKYQTEIEVPGKVTKPIEDIPARAGIEEPEPQYVQKFDDETQRWQIINKETGEVTNRKKSPGPYKSVPTMEEVKDAGDGEAGEQANTPDQAEDQR